VPAHRKRRSCASSYRVRNDDLAGAVVRSRWSSCARRRISRNPNGFDHFGMAGLGGHLLPHCASWSVAVLKRLIACAGWQFGGVVGHCAGPPGRDPATGLPRWPGDGCGDRAGLCAMFWAFGPELCCCFFRDRYQAERERTESQWRASVPAPAAPKTAKARALIGFPFSVETFPVPSHFARLCRIARTFRRFFPCSR